MAVIHIADGVAEHAGRYGRLAEALTGEGYAIYANDRRGHGDTASGPEDLGFFAEHDGWHMGSNLLFHLAGGPGGITHALDHLGGPMASWWKDLGALAEFTPKIKRTLIEGIAKEVEGRPVEQIAEERDRMLLGLLSLRAKVGRL